MWGNLSGVVGAAIQKVQKFQDEIENQMDEAVGKKDMIEEGTNAKKYIFSKLSYFIFI